MLKHSTKNGPMHGRGHLIRRLRRKPPLSVGPRNRDRNNVMFSFIFPIQVRNLLLFSLFRISFPFILFIPENIFLS